MDPRSALGRRVLLWAMLVIFGALLVATLSEMLAASDAEAQAHAVAARNATLRHDIAATQHAVATAQQPATIEREARGWGYIRPGDHPIIVVVPPAP
ncbi:MAG TPA: septum formation initiator family protein [Ktedonobacterales bacterium]|nr:septum formation initiator family protein [Ktedonobacterales bacterium]